jgi:hypothetical protein
MTEKSKQYLLALMISDIEDKRACLHVLDDEYREAKNAGQHSEAGDIASVINRMKNSLKAAEAAMEDLIGVETDEIIKKGE